MHDMRCAMQAQCISDAHDLQVSIDNAVAMTHSCATPLLVDPTGHAAAWVVKREQACGSSNSSSVEVTSPGSPGFVNALELAVRFGKVLSSPLLLAPCSHLERLLRSSKRYLQS